MKTKTSTCLADAVFQMMIQSIHAITAGRSFDGSLG